MRFAPRALASHLSSASYLSGELSPRANPKLDEHVLEVRLHGGAPHQKSLGDLGVREPLGDERDDLLLGWGQAGPSV